MPGSALLPGAGPDWALGPSSASSWPDAPATAPRALALPATGLHPAAGVGAAPARVVPSLGGGKRVPGIVDGDFDADLDLDDADFAPLVPLMQGYVPGRSSDGGKLAILFDMIQICVRHSERLLVFSQSLETLDVVEDHLSRQHIPGRRVNWEKGASYFRLDGRTAPAERQRMIDAFNSAANDSILLFLLSTRAGGLGINLVGANRVVIIDSSWNPSHDAQAVCRVFRYGQTRPCFIYRLVADGTMEKTIFDRQILKQVRSRAGAVRVGRGECDVKARCQYSSLR